MSFANRWQIELMERGHDLVPVLNSPRALGCAIRAWWLSPDPLFTAHGLPPHQVGHQIMLLLMPLSAGGDESCGQP